MRPDESSDKRRKKRNKSRILILMVPILLGIGYAVMDIVCFYPKKPFGGNGREVTVEIRKGVGPDGLGKLLNDSSLVESPGKFALWVRLCDVMPGIRAGTFVLKDDMSPEEIMSHLKSGRGSMGVKVTVPEGFRLSQLGELLEKLNLVDQRSFRNATFDKALLEKLNIPGPSAEGFLFPDTYYFEKDATAREIVKKMHDNFRRKTGIIKTGSDMDLKKIVTMASIVQAEAMHPDEAPIIAGVYYNRLNPELFPSGRLQADPTVAYGCDSYLRPEAKSCHSFDGVLKKKQLNDFKNPYNTYRHKGLPPGPVCLPGEIALRAAVSPADVPYLYFVASKNGRHVFSETFNQHQKAVEKALNRR